MSFPERISLTSAGEGRIAVEATFVTLVETAAGAAEPPVDRHEDTVSVQLDFRPDETLRELSDRVKAAAKPD